MEELNYDYHQKEHYDLPINNQLEINSTVNYPQSAF
jgi:hypothetical protein